MTFAEKLLQLRKREGYSQEVLAEKLRVSRQAISRWEMGTAMPDSPNLLQISKLFKVSADYLLNDDYESDSDIPAVKETSKTLVTKYNGTIRIIIGSIISSIAAIGLLVMGIISSVGDYRIYYPVPGEEECAVKTGFSVFLELNNIEWLFQLCIIVLIIGILVVVVPQKTKPILRRFKKCRSR